MVCSAVTDDSSKAVVLVNVLGFFNPLRELITMAVTSGFIQPTNVGLVVFVDGPADLSEHLTYDWGAHALEALQRWKKPEGFPTGYNWDWEKKLSDGLDLT